MLLETFPQWRKLAIAFGVVIVLLVAVGGTVIWSGFYNVAATREHYGVTTWLLTKVREQSIAARAGSVELPPLDDPDLWRLGAAHYEGGCAPCHGRPGETAPEVFSNMLPPPPRLEISLRDRTPEEVFWIVKHGLKYTGMPAWPAQSRPDEVDAMTAFLMRLPMGLHESGYRDLAGLGRAGEGVGDRLAQCGRCHEADGLPAASDAIPQLAGQSEAYLRRALAEYRAGLRPSGFMQPVASLLDDAHIEALSRRYAAMARPLRQDRPAVPPEAVLRGETLARQGDSADGLPPCLACHGAQRHAGFPDLAGQHANYIAQQLRAFRAGARNQTPWGAIMTAIALRLDDRQIEDAAAWFASIDAAPASTAMAEQGR